ncbi:MAG: DUF1508 domain-containing protein [Gemmatimonadales bacterium]|nr:DUF1508 domain-containing protein [Gemmatimonadales bacterium]
MLTRRAALQVAALALAGSSVAEAEGAELQFELYRTRNGDFRWRLKSANGRILAQSSEGYQSRAGCLTAIERIRTGAATATFEDLSGAK